MHYISISLHKLSLIPPDYPNIYNLDWPGTFSARPSRLG
jgi:hypothetical protein